MNARRSITCLLLGLAAAACASSNDGAPTTNGVDDVKKACEIRAGWAHATSGACSSCMGLASAERCACSDDPNAGRCSGQSTAQTNEPSCDDALRSCVSACAATDCACIDGCYAGKDACRARASALDGCLAEVCAPDCE